MAINKVILLGNVGKDPEIRYLENNVCVANFTLATSDRAYTSRSGAQIPERTEWHNIVAWRGLAETAEKYIRKGMQIYVEGKIRTRSWTDANTNTQRYMTEIFADSIELLGKRSDNNTQQAQAPSPQYTAQPKPVQEPLGGVQDSDELPF